MEYRSIFTHPDFGEIRNLTESAKYLGISKRKFRRIAPAPDHVEDGIYPFWARRILDILPLCDDFSQDAVNQKGVECGNYLIGELSFEELQKLRAELIETHQELACGHTSTVKEQICRILAERGVNIRFRMELEARQFRDGVLRTLLTFSEQRTIAN